MRLLEFDYTKDPITHRNILILSEGENHFLGYDISKLEPEEISVLRNTIKEHLQELEEFKAYSTEPDEGFTFLFPIFDLEDEDFPQDIKEKILKLQEKQKAELKDFSKSIRRFKKTLITNNHVHYWK